MTATPVHKSDWVDALTPVERALLRIPLVAACVRWVLKSQRAMRLERVVKQQVQRRSDFDFVNAWGDDPQRLRAARIVGDAIAVNLDLASARVVPNDALGTLIYDDDCLVAVQIRLDIEDALGGAVPDECFDEAQSVGDIVDRLVAHMRSPRSSEP